MTQHLISYFISTSEWRSLDKLEKIRMAIFIRLLLPVIHDRHLVYTMEK